MRVLTWEPDVEVTSGSTAMWGELGGGGGGGVYPDGLLLVPEVNLPGTVCVGKCLPSQGRGKSH